MISQQGALLLAGAKAPDRANLPAPAHLDGTASLSDASVNDTVDQPEASPVSPPSSTAKDTSLPFQGSDPAPAESPGESSAPMDKNVAEVKMPPCHELSATSRVNIHIFISGAPCMVYIQDAQILAI